MSETILHTHQLTKQFSKRIIAVNELDLDVHRGQVFGILGPNGSGKTTTLGMLLGVVTKTKGEFSWFDKGDHYSLRKKIGAILEQPNFYPFLSAVQNMMVHSRIKDISKPRIDELLKLVGLYDRRNDPFKTYSLGMKQRLAIASALLSDPEVLIFDEPTNGLDPQGIVEIRKLILEIHGMDKTIIMASHLLDEVQKVCTHFAVLQRGRKIYSGSVADALHNTDSVAVSADDQELLISVLNESPAVIRFEKEGEKVNLDLSEGWTASSLNRYLVGKDVQVNFIQQKKSSLEEKFLALLAENDKTNIPPVTRARK